MQTEREFELHKELEDLEEACVQYDRMERQLDQLEEDTLWQNRRSKELNDDLFECYPQDKKLQQLLLDREEMMAQRISKERNFFQEFRENIYEMKKETEQQKDDCLEELERVREEIAKGGEHDENHHNNYYF